YAELVKRIKGVYRTLNNNQLITRLVEWTRQLKGTAEKLAAKASTNVGAADLSWTSGNNCTPIATGSRDELLLDMVGHDKKEIEQVKKDLISGKRIRRNNQIYQIRDGQFQVLDEAAQQKYEKRLAIEYRAKTLAQKSGSWHVTDEHRQQAKELIELAYTYAEHDGRDSLTSTKHDKGLTKIGDWDLALLVSDGQVSAISENDWRSIELMG
ncbi:MAG: replication endonuclease, partial [Pseudoalteromonas sp.]|nr:replication endonuclease [Pseudoalteromonas sp.]